MWGREGEKLKKCLKMAILGKCHFLPGGRAPENWGDQVLCLRSKGGSKDFFQIKRGITYIL